MVPTTALTYIIILFGSSEFFQLCLLQHSHPYQRGRSRTRETGELEVRLASETLSLRLLSSRFSPAGRGPHSTCRMINIGINTALNGSKEVKETVLQSAELDYCVPLE